jgi:hypothetical protein
MVLNLTSTCISSHDRLSHVKGATWGCIAIYCRVAMQVLYALTAGAAGYVAAVLYKVMGGTNWVRNVLLKTALFCGPITSRWPQCMNQA